MDTAQSAGDTKQNQNPHYIHRLKLGINPNDKIIKSFYVLRNLTER